MFDGVVVDTGKVETVLAAAAARQVHCVLLSTTAVDIETRGEIEDSQP